MLALLQIGEMDLAEDEMRSQLQGANPDLAAGLLGIAQSFQLPSISLGLGVMAEQRDNVQADTDLYPLRPLDPQGRLHHGPGPALCPGAPGVRASTSGPGAVPAPPG